MNEITKTRQQTSEKRVSPPAAPPPIHGALELQLRCSKINQNSKKLQEVVLVLYYVWAPPANSQDIMQITPNYFKQIKN